MEMESTRVGLDVVGRGASDAPAHSPSALFRCRCPVDEVALER
jgi:hypothetical protein